MNLIGQRVHFLGTEDYTGVVQSVHQHNKNRVLVKWDDDSAVTTEDPGLLVVIES